LSRVPLSFASFLLLLSNLKTIKILVYLLKKALKENDSRNKTFVQMNYPTILFIKLKKATK